MTEKESNPKEKSPFAAVMPRSSSFTLLSAEKHPQSSSENECSIENMTYEQLLQLQYLPHKPIIRQPARTYSIPKTLKSSCRKYHSENSKRIHDRAQKKNGNEDSDEFGQIDTEEIIRVEQSFCRAEKRCRDANKKFTGNTSSETNCDITTTKNTENDPKTFEINLKQNKELLTGVTDKFSGKEFKVEKQNDEDNQNEKQESNDISIKPNVLLQEKMDRNEKVTKFLKGLPEMPSTSCNLKSPLYEEEKNQTTSDDPEDIHPVRSISCELNYEEDFESCGNDLDAESESNTDSDLSDFLENVENFFLLKEKTSNSNKKERKSLPNNLIDSNFNQFQFAPLIPMRRQSNKRERLKKSQAEINSLLDDLLGYDEENES